MSWRDWLLTRWQLDTTARLQRIEDALGGLTDPALREALRALHEDTAKLREAVRQADTPNP